MISIYASWRLPWGCCAILQRAGGSYYPRLVSARDRRQRVNVVGRSGQPGRPFSLSALAAGMPAAPSAYSLAMGRTEYLLAALMGAILVAAAYIVLFM